MRENALGVMALVALAQDERGAIGGSELPRRPRTPAPRALPVDAKGLKTFLETARSCSTVATRRSL
jgi:hypothetical protein